MADTTAGTIGKRTGERWNVVREQAEQIASTLPPLLVAAEQLASASVLGVHGRRKAGMGETFWQFRRYSIEDPSTAIDWRQSARSQHLFVREREWEVSESVWFWRDGSAGMRYQSSPKVPTKIDRATVLTLALSSLLVRGGERIALVGGEHAPASSRYAVRRLAHLLTELPLVEYSLPPEARLSKSGVLVWISDFLQPFDAIESRMRAFAHMGVKGFMVQIIDPAEEDFPFHGRVRFEMTTAREEALLGRAETVRNSYRSRYAAHAAAIGEVARRLGWHFLRHRTDKSPQTALVALYCAIGGARAQRGF